MPNLPNVKRDISLLLETPIIKMQPVGGATFDQACIAQSKSDNFFVKFGTTGSRITAEFEGLQELEKSNTVRVPRPILLGCSEGTTYMVTECISFAGPRSDSFEQLGHQMAMLHRFVHEKHGWASDNYIGATSQPNSQNKNWLEFFSTNRLSHQLRIAHKNGYCGNVQTLGTRLLDNLVNLLGSHTPVPSLLHGDLWSGNCSFDAKGNPVIFDPAVYYGDREADIAMTSLFGGFPSDFYHAYLEAWPFPEGHHERSDLYQLYHILNHLNLFGRVYLGQAESMMRRILSIVT